MKNTDYKKLSSSLVLAAVSLVVMTSAIAGEHRHHDDEDFSKIAYAKVTQVTPIYREIKTTTPVKECWKEPVTHTRQVRNGNSTGSTLAGGLIGGIIGHQIGKGRGRQFSTAVGTLIGAQLGHDAASGAHGSQYTYTAYEDYCEVENQVSYEQVLDSYNVTYRYRGESYTTNLPYDPGKKIKLRVTVEPVY
jgi:uncharacterized protein YcfJ